MSNVKTIVKNKVQRVEFIYLRSAISDFAICGPHLDRQDKEAGEERGDMLLVAYLPSNFPEISHYTDPALLTSENPKNIDSWPPSLLTVDYDLYLNIRVSQKTQKSEFCFATNPSGFHRLDEPPEKISAL